MIKTGQPGRRPSAAQAQKRRLSQQAEMNAAAKKRARMKILEDHNRQLEQQLRRLKELLTSTDCPVEEPPLDASNHFGTLTSKSVVAAKLLNEGLLHN